MEKTNYSYVKVSAGLIFTLCMMLCVMSCDRIDNPIRYGGSGGKNVPVNQVTNAIVAKTGASAAEVTSLLQEAMITPEVQQAILNNESFAVNVSVPGGSSAAGETITVPVSGGEGKNGGAVTINFTDAVTGTSESNPLNFTAANAGSAASGALGSGNSDNKLTINMPSGSTGLVITIDLPDTTVTLSTDGTTVYKSVSARTALNTLVVGKGVTVEDFIANGGRVKIMQGGKINRLVFAPRVYKSAPWYDHDDIFIDQLGAFGLAIMNVEGDYDTPENWTTFAVQDNGEWYRFKNLKILPPIDCDFMSIKAGIGPDGVIPSLETVTIADHGAIIIEDFAPKIDEFGNIVEGENASAFRVLQTVITGEGNDARFYYHPGMQLGGYKTMTNVNIMPMPDIIVDKLNRSLENGGWEHLALTNVQNGCDNCTFYIEQLVWNSDFLKDHKDIIIKNSKFKKVAINANEVPFAPNGLSYRIGADLNPNSIPEGLNLGDLSITFDGCDFEDRLRFFMNSDADTEQISSFTFKFINCKYNGQTMTKDNIPDINFGEDIPCSWGAYHVHDINPLHNGHVYYIIDNIKYEIREDPAITGPGPKPLILVQVDSAV